jgi:hypothetical protein
MLASRPGNFIPGERASGTHWIRGWVDPRAALNDVEKRRFMTLPGLEVRSLGRPARSQSLYRLRYAGSSEWFGVGIKYQTHFREIPSLNLGRNTCYFEKDYLGFPLSPPRNVARGREYMAYYFQISRGSQYVTVL